MIVESIKSSQQEVIVELIKSSQQEVIVELIKILNIRKNQREF